MEYGYVWSPNLHSPWGIPRKRVRPFGSGDWGCAQLWWRGRQSVACLHSTLERIPLWWFIYETTDVLSVRISTCCCSSCGWKSFRPKKTASSSRRFMCHRIWDSSYSPAAGIPSHTAPQPWVDAAVVTITRDATEHRGTPRLKWSGLRQSFDVAAMRKHPEVHAYRWIRRPESEQSLKILQLNRAALPEKVQEIQIGRGSISREAGFHLHAISREAGSHPHAISREAGSHPHAISREAGARMLSACWHIVLGTPSE